MVGLGIAIVTNLAVTGLGLEFFSGWYGFLWLECGALIFGVLGFAAYWKRFKI